jgi:hypothetical protein
VLGRRQKPKPRRAFERLIRDERAHEQISHGTRRLGAAYRRARMLRGQEAVQDKKIYDHVREAAGSLAEAARRVAGEPEPEPKRRARRLPVVVILAGVAVLVRAMHRRQQAAPSGPAAPVPSS